MNTIQAAAALLHLKDNVPTGTYTGPELAALVGATGPHASNIVQAAVRLGYITKTGNKARDPHSRNRVNVYRVERPDTHDEYEAGYSEGMLNARESEQAKCKDALKLQREELEATHKAAQDIYRAKVDEVEREWKHDKDIMRRTKIGALILSVALVVVSVIGLFAERRHREDMEALKAQHAIEAHAWAEIQPVEFQGGQPKELVRVEVVCKAYVDSGEWRSAEDGRVINGVNGWRP